MSHNLFDINGKKFEEYFEKNKQLDWNQWLVYDEESCQISNGKQGYTGILKHPHNKNLSCIFKISKEDDNVIFHEYNIMKGLYELSTYCPHFHQCFGILNVDTNIHVHRNPLKVTTDTKIVQRPMLLQMFVKNIGNLNNLIEDEKIDNRVVINCIKQVVLAIIMSHTYKFTHYDLHSENVLIRNCNPNLYLLYIIDEKHCFLLPSNGYIINIIDFGFSFIENPIDPTLYCTLVHTKQGFTSTRFDQYADLKLFLVSSVDDLGREEFRKQIYGKMKNIIRNIFSGMNIQWNSGWDHSRQTSPVTIIHELVKEYIQCSPFLTKNDIWFESIQLLINQPLSSLPYHDLETCFKSFAEEFTKFEQRIASKTLLNYILKVFTLIVKKYRSSYLKGGEEASWAIIEIKRQFLEEYTKLVSYHVPSLDYDKIICSLLLISQCVEGLYYEYLQKRYEEKDQQYTIMKCSKTIEFIKILEAIFPWKQNKNFSTKTQILVIDNINKRSSTIQLKTQDIQVIQKLNTSLNDEKKVLLTQYLKNLYLSNYIN